MVNNRLTLKLWHAKSRLLHRYADWRIQATEAEKHCYKESDSILLTFDDYGPLDSTDSILKTLAEKEVKAMFFIQGDWAKKQPLILERIQSAGHIVGNHTYSHPDLLSLSEAEAIQEIKSGLAGPWLRAPMGRYNRHLSQLARRHGYYMCYWTIDSQDWTNASSETIRHTIISELRPNAVILFHLHGRLTPEILPGLIDSIREKGYELTGFQEKWSPTGQGQVAQST